MSRIHEALKKAEQERAIVAPQRGATSSLTESGPLADLTSSAPPALGVRETVPSELSVASTPVMMPGRVTPGEYLRFDDLRKQCAHPDWNFDPNLNVFANPVLSQHGAEQFRTLRSRLYQSRSNQSLRSLLITSSVPGEGKTFVTVNLAQAIVRQPDRRAIIIDADLRRPRVHTLLGSPNAPGLTDYLRGEADEAAIVQFGPEGSLCLIPGGNEVTNPSELLLNGRLGELIQRLAPVFDWIILDSPPCLPVADASILAGVCEGILLVVKSGSTPSAVAQRARQELQKRNIVGVVLNAVGEAQMYGAEYYDAYHYGFSNDGSKDSRQ